jgi:hypothetical protein
MNIPGGLFFLAQILIIFGLVVFVLSLMSRFVAAHERSADALQAIARKMKDGNAG